jgi:hypothetical protein
VNSFSTINNAEVPSAGTSSTTDLKLPLIREWNAVTGERALAAALSDRRPPLSRRARPMITRGTWGQSREG